MADPTRAPHFTKDDIRVEPITDPADFTQAFDVIAAAFGVQIEDAIWRAMNPGWDTPEGRQRGIEKQIRGWRSFGTLRDGQPSSIYAKATVADAAAGHADGRRIVGVALWDQWSPVEGWGNAPHAGLPPGGAARLHPDDEREQRFVDQVARGLYRRRHEVALAKADAEPPAVFVLDLCVTDPPYQRRGVAEALVRFGLAEARRRGGLECVTEASVMGRGLYKRLGFRAEGDGRDIEWGLDDEFKDRRLPPNVFLRTGPE